MSNWNSWENDPWENQLASWRPRRPAPRLRTRLFDATSESVAMEEPNRFWAGWRWLAPAVICSFMALVALSPRNDRLARLGAGNTNNFLSDMAGSQKYSAYLMAGFHSEQNGPLRETLAWTFAP